MNINADMMLENALPVEGKALQPAEEPEPAAQTAADERNSSPGRTL